MEKKANKAMNGSFRFCVSYNVTVTTLQGKHYHPLPSHPIALMRKPRLRKVYQAAQDLTAHRWPDQSISPVLLKARAHSIAFRTTEYNQKHPSMFQSVVYILLTLHLPPAVFCSKMLFISSPCHPLILLPTKTLILQISARILLAPRGLPGDHFLPHLSRLGWVFLSHFPLASLGNRHVTTSLMSAILLE